MQRANILNKNQQITPEQRQNSEEEKPSQDNDGLIDENEFDDDEVDECEFNKPHTFETQDSPLDTRHKQVDDSSGEAERGRLPVKKFTFRDQPIAAAGCNKPSL